MDYEPRLVEVLGDTCEARVLVVEARVRIAELAARDLPHDDRPDPETGRPMTDSRSEIDPDTLALTASSQPCRGAMPGRGSRGLPPT